MEEYYTNEYEKGNNNKYATKPGTAVDCTA